MMDEYFAVPISPSNKRAMAQMDALLAREGIERDRNLTYSAAIYDDDGQMIATGSLFENTLRCLAVDGAHRGEGLMAVIVAHLVQAQIERGHTHLFLYTKVDSAKFFAPLGFTEIARVDGRLVFMENRRDGFSRYLKSLAPYAGERPGAALVMNANPFTLGHETLVARAAVLPKAGVELVVIPRAQAQGEAISASHVRQLIHDGHIEAIRPLVPETTYAYLTGDAGQAVLRRIQAAADVIHH